MDWDQWDHAYGPATDIPALLDAAAESPAAADYTDEPWNALWSRLCHPGDVFSASLAAVPELVAIAVRRRGEVRVAADCLLLAGSIEMERHSAPTLSLPADLLPRYQDALARGAELAATLLPHTDDPLTVRMLSLSLAAFQGDIAGARRLADGGEP